MKNAAGKFNKENQENKNIIVNTIERAVYVERLPDPRRNRQWGKSGIYPFGGDNLYPQKAVSFYQRSSTTKTAADTFSNFIFGEGFEDENLNYIEINSEGLTFGELAEFCINSFSINSGFAVHVNYNVFGEIIEMNACNFEDYRVKSDNSGMIIFNPDWLMHDTRKNIEYYPFNPLKVATEIEESGGIENYKGQIMYWHLQKGKIYPLSFFDAVFDDAQFEAESKLTKLSNVQNRFAADIIFKYPMRLGDEEFTKLKEQVKKGTGSANSGSTMMVGVQPDVDGKIPDKIIEEIPRTGIDKLFELQNKETRDNIYALYKQPPILSGRPKEGGFQGDEYKDSFDMYNSLCQNFRNKIEKPLRKLLENSIFNFTDVVFLPKDFQIMRTVEQTNTANEQTTTIIEE